MRRYLALVSVALLAFAGCTSGDEEPEAAPSTTAAGEKADLDPALVGRAPGVTDDTIKVGVVYVDLEAIREVTQIDHGDYEATYRALLDDINARGGVHGRQLEPVFAPVNPIGTDGADAACVRLAQDEPVFVAMGFFLDENVLCLLEAHETAVIGGTITPDRLARAKAPWYSIEQSSEFQADALRALIEAGELDGNLGVFGMADQEVLVRDTVEPILEELGIEPIEVAMVDAPPDDVAAANAATAVIAERFRSSDVDTVLVVGQAASAWLRGTEPLDYRPSLRFLGVNETLSYINDAAGRDLSGLEGAVVGDVYGPKPDQFHEATFQDECLPALEAAGLEVAEPPVGKVEPGTPETITSARTACMGVHLLVALLEEAGEELDYATLEAAADRVGELQLPTSPEPYFYGNGEHADGDPPIYLYDWDPATKAFERRER